MEQEILTPAALWRDFDPTTGPLEVNIVKEEERNGIVYKQVYFTGRTEGGAKSRVFAETAHKAGEENLPGVVLIGPQEKGIDEFRLEFWALCGYAAISIDNCGQSDRPMFTQYPPQWAYANFTQAGRHLTHVDTTARETCWYEWAINVRRGITFFEREPYVDGNRIGAHGTLNGAITLCHVLAFDSRLKTAIVGYHSCYVDRSAEKTKEDATPEEIQRVMQAEDERDRWYLGVAPQSYPMYFRVPVLLECATNSVLTDVDNVAKVLVPLSEEQRRQTYLSLEARAVRPEAKTALPNVKRWMDMTLKSPETLPEKPSFTMEVQEGKLLANISARGASDVRFYYARATEETSCRNWVQAPLKVSEEKMTATLRVVNASHPVYAFCSITVNDFTFSTLVNSVVPGKLGEVETAIPTKLLYQSSEGLKEFAIVNPAESEKTLAKNSPLTVKEAALGVKGIYGKTIGTFQLFDELYNTSGAVMLADVCSQEAQELTVWVQTERGTPEQTLFAAHVSLVGGNLWQKITLTQNDFKSNGKTLSTWRGALCFTADKSFLLNNLLFT